MRTAFVLFVRRLACVTVFLITTAPALAGDMPGPRRGLVRLSEPTSWFLSIAHAQSDRELRFEDSITPIEFNRMIASTGVDLLSFLTLQVEAGWVSADAGMVEGEGGFEWGVGATVALWEYVIEETSAIPRRQTLRIETDVIHRARQSTLDEAFEWTQFTVSPVVRYTHERRAEVSWNHRMPSGVSAYAGFQHADWDITYGTREGEGNRDFAVRLGADLRIASGWVTRLDAILYNGSDRRFTIGMGYYF